MSCFPHFSVSKVSSDQEVIHPTAYILFYERIDPKPNSDSLSTKVNIYCFRLCNLHLHC